MSSILLSAFALECFVNELEERLEHPYLSESLERLERLNGMLSLLEQNRATLLARIDAIHLALKGEGIDRGTSQFLNALRNALVHRRPERFQWELGDSNEEHEPHKFVSYLVQRNVIPKPGAGQPQSWSQYVLVPEAARWAHNRGGPRGLDRNCS